MSGLGEVAEEPIGRGHVGCRLSLCGESSAVGSRHVHLLGPMANIVVSLVSSDADGDGPRFDIVGVCVCTCLHTRKMLAIILTVNISFALVQFALVELVL